MAAARKARRTGKVNAGYHLGVKDAFTLASVAFGVTSVFACLSGSPLAAGIAIALAAVADYVDGKVARSSTGGANGVGKQLDSLADAVSFGLAPVVLAITQSVTVLTLGAGIAFACCGVIRLARFNVQMEEGVFFGLPIPVAAVLAAAAALVWPELSWLAMLILSALMVCGIRIGKP